jgi:uncharacterized membrane protein
MMFFNKLKDVEDTNMNEKIDHETVEIADLEEITEHLNELEARIEARMDHTQDELEQLKHDLHVTPVHLNTFGQKLSDVVAKTVGSWKFIMIQTSVIIFWVICNVQMPQTGWNIFGFQMMPWDPYPFIFLNLTLSFQAAYTAPIIMMSQNRQSEIDRRNALADHRVNREVKLEVASIKMLLSQLLEQQERQKEQLEKTQQLIHLQNEMLKK